MNETVIPKNPTAQASNEIGLLDLVQVVADNIKLLTVGPLTVGMTALAISFAIPPTYTASTKFLPPQQQQNMAAGMLSSLGALGGLAGAGMKNPADQYVSFLESRSISDALIERFKLQERYNKKLRTDTRTELAKKVRITSGKDGLITLEVDEKDPNFAADLANAHIEELGSLMSRLAVTEAQNRRVFFEKQLLQVKDQLTTAEQALQSSGINASALKSTPAEAVATLAQIQALVRSQEVRIAAMRSYLTESAPEVRQAMSELSALRSQLAKLENSSNRDNNNADYVARYREFKYQETLFELFSKQYELARVDEAREGAVIQVVDIAQTPERPSQPKKTLIAISATLISSLALLAWIFIRYTVKVISKNPEISEKLKRLYKKQNS